MAFIQLNVSRYNYVNKDPTGREEMSFSTRIALPSQLVGFLLADTLAGESLYYLANFSEDYKTLTLSSQVQENVSRAETDVRARIGQLEREISTRETYMHSMYVPLLATVQGESDVADMETLYHVKVTFTESKLSIQQFQRTVLSFAQQDPVTHQYHFFTKDLSNLAIFRQSGESLDVGYFPLSPNARSVPRPIWSYSQSNGQFASFDGSESQQIENLLHFGGSRITLSGDQCIMDFSVMTLTVLSGQVASLQREPPILGLPVQHVVVNIQGLDTCIESARATLQGRLKKKLKTLKCPLLVSQPWLSSQLELQQQVTNYCRQFCVEFSLEASAQPTLSLTGADGYVDRIQENVVEFIRRGLLVSPVSHQQAAIPLDLVAHPPTLDDAVPSTWIPQGDSNCVFTIVARNTEEWNKFEGLLRKTLRKIRIYGLERVQNRILWQRYSLEGRQMLKRNGGKTNEKFLFHGTSKMDPYKITTSESGIDFRCSSQERRLMWGKGAYFAGNASYSDQYSYNLPNDRDGKRQMLIVSVFTGHCCDFGSTRNEELTRPPERSSGKLYDTVHGMVNNCDIYIVYDHSKSYPAYVVTYTK